MLEKVLKELGFKVEVYVLQNSKKNYKYELDKGNVMEKVGCGKDKWSYTFPFIIVSKEELENIKKISKTDFFNTYEKITEGIDKRTVRLNSYERSLISKWFK